MDELREAVARAICRAAITHEVVGDVPATVLETMIENLTIKYFPEADAAIAAARPIIREECAKVVDRYFNAHNVAAAIRALDDTPQ